MVWIGDSVFHLFNEFQIIKYPFDIGQNWLYTDEKERKYALG